MSPHLTCRSDTARSSRTNSSSRYSGNLTRYEVSLLLLLGRTLSSRLLLLLFPLLLIKEILYQERLLLKRSLSQ